MSGFKAKIFKIQFPVGLRAYSAPTDPLAVFKGPTCKGREGEEDEGKRERKEGGKGRSQPPNILASIRPASVKSRLVLPFWYRLTRVVPDKGPLNGCECVC